MSKELIIESKHGEKEIMRIRRKSREENRQADMDLFRVLIDRPMNSLNKPTKTKVYKNGNTKEVVDTSLKEVWARGDKLTAQIIRLYQGYPGYEAATDDEESVTLDMISRLAKTVVDGPLELQLQLCREPNRQTSDERVQFAIRQKYLPDWNVENLAAGHLTLKDGEWVYDNASDVASDEHTKARSIDFRITKGDITIMDFAKFAHVAGGGQGHQIKESKYFLAEVRKYIDKHPNEKTYFVDTLDGGYAEKFIDEHRELLLGYEDRVFVGNTESIIDWINSK